MSNGAWNSGNANFPSLDAHTRYTRAAGASGELDFACTGVAWTTEKGPEFGEANVYLDGKKTTLVLATPNFPRIYSVRAFAADGLAKGRHRIRIVNAASQHLALAQFDITD